jgi:hypothetical protein
MEECFQWEKFSFWKLKNNQLVEKYSRRKKLTLEDDKPYVFGFIANWQWMYQKKLLQVLWWRKVWSNETSKLANEQLLSALDAKAGEAKGEFF